MGAVKDRRVTWKRWLSEPPADVIEESARLLQRAASMVEETLLEQGAALLPPEIDVVVGGSGFKALYYLGVHTILAALEDYGATQLQRFAGASSGAQTPFQLLLVGVERSLACHLAYGRLCEQFSPNAGLIRGAINADKDWKVLANHLWEVHGDRIGVLDGRVYVSVSILKWFYFRNVLVSRFSRNDGGLGVPKRTREAFHATGTMLTKFDGRWATDGGLTNNLPIFKDGLRPVLVVNPLKVKHAAMPTEIIPTYKYGQALAAIELGQDEALEFLLRRKAPQRDLDSGAISLLAARVGEGEGAAASTTGL